MVETLRWGGQMPGSFPDRGKRRDGWTCIEIQPTWFLDGNVEPMMWTTTGISFLDGRPLPFGLEWLGLYLLWGV
jgi:hypothetical protein